MFVHYLAVHESESVSAAAANFFLRLHTTRREASMEVDRTVVGGILNNKFAFDTSLRNLVMSVFLPCIAAFGCSHTLCIYFKKRGELQLDCSDGNLPFVRLRQYILLVPIGRYCRYFFHTISRLSRRICTEARTMTCSLTDACVLCLLTTNIESCVLYVRHVAV